MSTTKTSGRHVDTDRPVYGFQFFLDRHAKTCDGCEDITWHPVPSRRHLADAVTP